MSTQTSSFKLDAKATQKIIAKRRIFRAADAGTIFKFDIQGNGTTIPVLNKDKAQVNDAAGLPLYKTIYNTNVNSHVAMLNPRNQAILREAMVAETAGNMELAHEKFNEYLNAVQVSFSVILNNGRTNPVFSKGDLVKGKVQLITTDNGQLLTVENVTAVRIEEASSTMSFNLSDLMGLSDEKPSAADVFTPLTEGATAEDVFTLTTEDVFTPTTEGATAEGA